jgi:hypothetical protein
VDLRERNIQLAQSRDQPGALQLVARVEAIAGALVPSRGFQHAQLDIQAQCRGRQAGQAGELADAQQLQLAIPIVDVHG